MSAIIGCVCDVVYAYLEYPNVLVHQTHHTHEWDGLLEECWMDCILQIPY